jgi:hypothetical protein
VGRAGIAAQVALDHAREWDLAGVLAPPDSDKETPGAPGFTGENGPTRCHQTALRDCVQYDAPGVSAPALPPRR